MNPKQKTVLRAFAVFVAMALVYVPWQGRSVVAGIPGGPLQYAWLWFRPENPFFDFQINWLRLGLEILSLLGLLVAGLVCLGERREAAPP